MEEGGTVEGVEGGEGRGYRRARIGWGRVDEEEYSGNRKGIENRSGGSGKSRGRGKEDKESSHHLPVRSSPVQSSPVTTSLFIPVTTASTFLVTVITLHIPSRGHYCCYYHNYLGHYVRVSWSGRHGLFRSAEKPPL